MKLRTALIFLDGPIPQGPISPGPICRAYYVEAYLTGPISPPIKGRCRRLKILYVYRLHLISSVIIAACCVHNFVIDIDGIDDDDFADFEEEAGANDLVVDHEQFLIKRNQIQEFNEAVGQIKRNRIETTLL